MDIKVVGCDPSLRNFGLVKATLDIESLKFKVDDMILVESEDDAKKQKTVRKNSDDLRRARLLYEGFQDACKDASFAFVEVPVGSQSARAMASYGMCLGVLASHPIPMIQVTPTEVKKAGTGFATATKSEMIDAAVEAHPYAKWLTRKFKGELLLTGDNEHLADALFAIKAGIATAEFKGAIAMFKSMKVA
jgi:Holliday junction resolvasome RuvABC endonuclease subunit